MTTIRPGAEAAARAAIAARVEALLRRADAVHEPWRVVGDPAVAAEVCTFWVRGHRDRDGAPTVDVVAGPGVAGALLAYETARQLGIGAAADARAIAPRQRVLLVAPSGPDGGLLELLVAVEAAGGDVVGCHAIVGPTLGRSVVTSPASRRRYPFQALWRRPRSIETPDP